MGKNNLAVNQLLERKDIFADLINGSLFDGKNVLDPDKMELKSGHTGVMQEHANHRMAALERYGDVRMEADMGTYSVIFAEETQNAIDYAMPVRNMLYEALEYTKQIKDLEKLHHQEEKKSDYKDFLSGMHKSDRLKPVITLVLYCGEEWDGEKCLRDMLKIDWESESAEMVKSLIPDYRLWLIRPNEIQDMQVFRTCLQQIFSMVKYKSDKKMLYSYMQENKAALDKMDYVETLAAFVLLGESKRAETYLYGKENEGAINMCKAIDELIEDGRKEGIKEGEERLSSLIHEMIRDNCSDLLSQVASDRSFRERMYRKYQL